MEKKNSAIEKVEKISSESSKPKTSDKPTKAETIKKEVQNGKGRKTTVKTTKKSTENTKSKKPSKQEKEKIKAKSRLEKAKVREQKKELKKKASADRKQAMLRKKEEYRLERLRKKEERIKRRDMLKNESREEKNKRIAAEKKLRLEKKQAILAEKRLKREERAAVRREKIEARKALKEQRRRLSYENKKDRRSRGFGGWLAAVISLGGATLVLATLFTLSLFNGFGTNNDMFQAGVERTFYDLVSYVDNMEVNMSKLLVSSTKSEQQRILSELSVQANLAASDVTELPLQDESKFYTTKYINQVGDYSKYLNNKLIDGGTITETDWQNLSKLYEINNSLKSELSELSASIGEEYEFMTLLDDNSDNIVLQKFVELESNAVDYPKMIYDGPFSDSLKTESAKGIIGEEISASEAEQIFKNIFSSFNPDMVELTGESNGTIPTYNIEAETDDGMLFAQISKVGGNLVLFDAYKDCSEINVELKDCIAAADSFLKDAGLENMTAVWTTTSGNTVYLNYAYKLNGVIVYPDMCKVTVCMDRGVVSGFSATEYYLNHTKRTLEKAKLTQEDVMKNVSSKLDVDNVRLVVIPKGNGSESLCYEVAGTFNGATYYVYVDAKTGNESQIFRVVETTEGTLLI